MKHALSLVALAVLSSASYADTAVKSDLEVIEVNSQFRQVNLLKTQGSISLFDDNDIANRHATHTENLLGSMANVNFSSGASRGNYVQIRGIGLRSQFVDPINPSVGLLIDGINYSGLGGAAALFDVDNVTLYRGPQGTQFGNDAMAGMITLNTTAATDEQVNRAQLSVGDYGSYSYGVAVGGAITEGVNMRLSAYNNQSDGYITNDHLNRKDTNNIDESNVKLKTRIQATEKLAINTTLHYVDNDNGYDAFSLDQNRHTLSDTPGHDTQDTIALGVNAIYSGFDGGQLQVDASLLDSELLYSYDEDWAYDGIHDWGYNSYDSYERTRKQNTLDIRFVSDGYTLLNNSLSWVSGIYLNQRDSGLERVYTYADGDFVSDNSHSDQAIYGQLAYQMSAKTTLTLGARLGSYEIEYSDNNGVIEEKSSQMYGWHFDITNQVNDQAMTYLTLSRSDKAGGINGDALAKVSSISTPSLKLQLQDQASFAPETLYSAEFGVKGQSLDQRLTIKLAAFYQYRQDVQLQGHVTDKIGETEADTFVGYTDNAGSGRGYGLELETHYSVMDNVNVYANLGYLDTAIKDYVLIKEEGANLDMHNRQMAHAPEYQFSVGVDYIADNGFYGRAEVQGKDSFYYSDSHNEQSDFYALTNVSLGYQGQNWRVNLAANNVLDRQYAVRGFYFGNDPRDYYSAHNYVQLGAPSTVNLSVEVTW